MRAIKRLHPATARSFTVDPPMASAQIDCPLTNAIRLPTSHGPREVPKNAMVIDTDTRRAPEAEVRRQADTVRAFRALLEDPARLGYAYFVRRWIERGMPRRDAERRFVHLLTDLKDLEAELRVNTGDTPVDQPVLNDDVSWRRYTGQRPDTSKPSAFVKFRLALASLAELPL